MLQQTTVATVRERFAAFVRRWPTVADLANAPLEQVLAEWAGLGYYARARNLHACAQIVADELGGDFPKTAAELEKLPGIGAYTSAAIAAIAFKQAIVPVDGNIERIGARFFAIEDPLPKAKPQIATAVQQFRVHDHPGEVAQALMDLGSSLCGPKKLQCALCPLQAGCAGHLTGKALGLPVKPAKKKRPKRLGHVYAYVSADGAILLRRRADKGLLAAMSEMPGSAWEDSLPAFDPPFPQLADEPAGIVRHIFTHFELELTVWQATAERFNPPEGYWWQPLANIGEAGLPTLMVKALDCALTGERSV